MSLSENILQLAKDKGACEPALEHWNPDWDVMDLVKFYMDHPDWCLRKKFPSLPLLEQHCSNDEICKLGMFVSKSVAMRIVNDAYVFNNCKVGLICGGVSTLYFGLNSKAKIIVENMSDLRIDYYDNTEIEVETRGSGRCTIYRYGSCAPVVRGKNIKVRDKRNEKL